MYLRQLALACLTGALVFAAAWPAAGAADDQPNAIQVENMSAGTALGTVPRSAAGRAIEGYGSETSALPGDTLHYHVSAVPAAPYRIEVYRLGWYGGTGARLVGCMPNCADFRPGQSYPMPAPDGNGMVTAGWPVTDSFTLPADAETGYYRARFVLANGRSTDTYVIVRPPPGEQAHILVQVPVNTWQAYNTWGGRSLYDIAGQAIEGNRVSFDRPYSGNGLANEYPFVLFLEREGYDVAYQTDVDTDNDPSSLLGYKLVVALGHGEYWTSRMRDAFEAARDAGVNLAFMGSNQAYWQVRYENDDRVIVGYKSTADPVDDPTLETILFRALTPERRECELEGIQHQGGDLGWPPGDLEIAPSSLDDSWFADTGFDGTSVLTGLAGVEVDTIPATETASDSCGHQLTVFFHRELGGDTLGSADTVAYTSPSGAVVFDAGSKRFVWGLADGSALSGVGQGLVDPRLQRFVLNMIDDLSASRSADLGVTLTADGEAPARAGPVSVAAVLTNYGPDGVRSATVDISLKPGVRFVRVASKSVRCTRLPLRCRIEGLRAGATVLAVFTLGMRGHTARPMTARISAATATDPKALNSVSRVAVT
jgi:hypothetical protein